MKRNPTNRGFATVGFLEDLEPVETLSIRYLRMWYDGPDHQSEVWREFSGALGAENGRNALKSFEMLLDICFRHGRRTLMRHGVDCPCLSADERCFATLIGYASECQREDAFLIATALVRPDVAAVLSGLAEDVGLALRRMTLRQRETAPRSPEVRILH